MPIASLNLQVDGWGWFDNSQVAGTKENSKEFTQLIITNPCLPICLFFIFRYLSNYQAWKEQKK